MDDENEPNFIVFNNSLWDDIWTTKLAASVGPNPRNIPFWKRAHLLFSLFIFLNFSIGNFLDFVFTSKIPLVKQKVGKYLQYRSHGADENHRFAPARLWSLWHQNPKAIPHLHSIAEVCASEIVLQESNNIIEDRSLKVKVKGLMGSKIRSLLAPRMLYEKYCKLAPFTTTLLRIFTASPNRYQQRKSANKDKSSDSESNIEMEDVQSDGSPDQSGRLEDTFIASGDIKTEADAQNTESLDVTKAVSDIHSDLELYLHI